MLMYTLLSLLGVAILDNVLSSDRKKIIDNDDRLIPGRIINRGATYKDSERVLN